ncbi:MAG: AMP-binding protein, partial [bacterium]
MTKTNQCESNWQPYEDLLENRIETLPQLLLYRAEQRPDEVFHRRKDFGVWRRYTWKMVLDQVKNLAGGLLALGIERGDTVALVGENEPQLFWAEYAAQAIGAKVACLYPDLTAEQMHYLLDDSDSVLVICEDQEQVDKVLNLESQLPDVRKVIYWDNRGMWQYDHPLLMTLDEAQEQGRAYFEARPGAFRAAVQAGKGSDIAVLSYTSGTTGLPKGCLMAHDNLFDTAFRVAGSIRYKENTQYLSYISPAWATEQMFGLTMGLLVPFVVNFPEEPDTVQQNIREIGTEALMLGPRQWESLASVVETKMMEAGPIRRAIYKMGIAIGRKVNIARLEGRRMPLGWLLLYPLADWAVLYHLR